MTEHTPGPWTIRGEGETFGGKPNGEWRIDDEHHMPLATTHGEAGGRSSKRAHANARLIAAAPEMYQALLAIARGLTNGQIARGESPQSIAQSALRGAGLCAG